jgi:hypothetical protein
MIRLKFALRATTFAGRAREPHDLPDFEPTQPLDLHGDPEELIWHESSFDLRSGLDISEQPIDTLPGELHEFFERK